MGRFPFSEDQASDDSDLEDLQGTLSPGKPIPSARAIQKGSREDKERKRRSMGVSLQSGARTMSILELLQHIINKPAPRLMPEGKFPRSAEEFVDACLLKEPEVRKTPKELLVSIFSGVRWGVALVNSLVIRCCRGWSTPGHLTLICRLGHPPFDRNRLQARSICLSARFIIYVALSPLCHCWCW